MYSFDFFNFKYINKDNIAKETDSVNKNIKKTLLI